MCDREWNLWSGHDLARKPFVWSLELQAPFGHLTALCKTTYQFGSSMARSKIFVVNRWKSEAESSPDQLLTTEYSHDYKFRHLHNIQEIYCLILKYHVKLFSIPSTLIFLSPELQYQPKAVRQMTCSSFRSSMKIPINFVASRQNQRLKHGQNNPLLQNVLTTTKFVVRVICIIYEKYSNTPQLSTHKAVGKQVM
jgi:hypothetical protein